MMLLVNLAEPDWVQIDCYQKLLPNVLCYMKGAEKKRQLHINVTDEDKRRACSRTQILMNNLCFSFLWYDGMGKNSMEQLCKKHNEILYNLQNITLFQYLFDAVSVEFAPFLSQHSSEDYLHKFTYKRFANTYVYRHEEILSRKTTGLHLCSSEKKLISLGDNIFHCKYGSSVSHIFICNGVVDCPFDNSDEMQNCHLFSNARNKLKTFSSCGTLFYMTVDKLCVPYFLKENVKLPYDQITNFSYDLMNDLVSDTGPEGQDELQLITILTSSNMTSCTLPYELPCVQGHSKCYSISDICKYTLNDDSHLMPCRNGNHLQNCRGFQCNSMFKCTNSYCIHWSYVNDGKWDCPHGEDEHDTTMCTGMFKCKGSRMICIHLANVCDKYMNCPYDDDELLCSLTDVKCVHQCNCFGLAIACKNSENNFAIEVEYPYISVYLEHMYNFRMETIKNKFPQTVFGIFLSNDIVDICQMYLPFNIIYLDLGFNHIHYLYQGCFRSSLKIRFIFMDNNLITHIQKFAFWPLYNVSLISLCNNPILAASSYIIPFVHIKYFSMKNSTPVSIESNAFHGTSIEVIDVSDFHICCITQIKSQCVAHKAWYISCDSLLPKIIITNVCILVMVLMLCITFVSFVIQNLVRRVQTAAFGAIVLSLIFNNLLCVIYLSFIVIADFKYQMNYIVNDVAWRSGPVCFAAFSFILSFTISNQILHLLMSTSRLMVVVSPMKTKFKSYSFVVKCLFYIYTSVLFFTFCFTIIIRYMESILPFKLCFPFIDPTKSVNILHNITYFICLSQLVCLLIICIQNTVLFKIFQQSKQKTNKSFSDVGLKRTLAMGTGSVALCWFPTSIIYIALLMLPKYPINLIPWTVVVIMPITSLIYPSVFIVMNLKKIIGTYKIDNILQIF